MSPMRALALASAHYLSNPEQRRGYKVTAAHARILATLVDDELRLLEDVIGNRYADAELVRTVRSLRGVLLPLVPSGTK